MRSGILLTFQNLHSGRTDGANMMAELQLGEMAEGLGFDTVWSVEHHFDNYAMCPDNFTVLAYLAARTSTIKLATGAVILPWNDPLRVAEKAIMLDILSGGRFVLGLGRGLARMEYEGFGIDMNEARERFEEATGLILGALETGVMEGSGPYYPQARVQLRPEPLRSFRDRVYSVGISPESVLSAAAMGTGLIAFVQQTLGEHASSVDIHRDAYRAAHGSEAPIPVLAQPMYCHADASVASERAYSHIGQHMVSTVKHYDFAGEHFAKIKGYQSYSANARAMREDGMDASVKRYVDLQLWGTPDQILERIRTTKAEIGEFEVVIIPAFGDMEHDQIVESYELFAKEVLPALDRL